MRKALLVGINHYKNAPLKGCIPDARRMHGGYHHYKLGSVTINSVGGGLDYRF